MWTWGRKIGSAQTFDHQVAREHAREQKRASEHVLNKLLNYRSKPDQDPGERRTALLKLQKSPREGHSGKEGASKRRCSLVFRPGHRAENGACLGDSTASIAVERLCGEYGKQSCSRQTHWQVARKDPEMRQKGGPAPAKPGHILQCAQKRDGE